MLMTAGEVSELSAQRVDARARLEVRRSDGRTRIERLYQEGAAKIRMPVVRGDPLEAILINTAGGLTGGDRVAWEIEAGAGAAVTVTTQACEKLYRSRSGEARADVRLSVAKGGRIAWLPQETIVYDRSCFARRLEVDLADDAQALVVEATLFGRRAMGETVAQALFRDRWRVRQGGRLVHAEAFSIGPDLAATLARPAAAGGGVAVATVLLVAPDAETYLEQALKIIGDEGGASFWTVGGTGKLLARLVAGDGYALRRRLTPLVGLLNGQAGLPKIWSL
ncbi:urease accessory protein UreD [Mesorhizobium sp. KR9-304]|uniref:urease accessory protein UreD n=1 Tax=Mesorhizobium sp. KR9-304 TaxID=3156614 RepID=UPI0032B55A53